ncbi:MAG: RNA methyltransferase [Pseudomonadota bacterium]
MPYSWTTCKIGDTALQAMDFQPELITSPTNPAIKRLRGLDRKKMRQETGLFLAEGARLVGQGLERGWTADIVLVASGSLERDYMRSLVKTARDKGARVIEVPERLIAKVTQKDNPQTVVAAFRQDERSLADLETQAKGLWIALYEVRDPGNLGTILRTADCAGVGGVILLETCCDPYSIEAVRASMGSIFDMPFIAAQFEAFDAWRKAQGALMVAASVNGTARHDRIAMDGSTVLLMGNEQAGLPNAIEARCDTLCLIPMRGGADSLNLAQATAIMTYEAWRQRDFQ